MRQGGRRADLSRHRIASTALDLLDREGLASLSMRRLAETLGVGTMSIYHYVSDKDDLTDALIELVLADVHRPRAGEPWTDMALAVATSFRSAALAHPAAVRLLLTRPASASSSARWLEVVQILRQAGLSQEEARRVFRSVSRFVVGWCLAEIVEFGDGGEHRRRASGDDDFIFGLTALIEALARRVPRPGG
jgi:TetR/AcrR family tetracycline transcriptional repressor